MSDVETRFHEAWLGLVQPIEGLVVSVPVLVDAQCMQRQPPETQHRLLELCPPVEGDEERRRIADLEAFFAELLDLTPDLFDAGDAIGDDLGLYVPEGRQVIKPTMALRALEPADGEPAHVMLVWELPDGLDLDKAETETGPWEYPPAAKFDRLLRHCRVPIGLLTNGRVLRLVYAPHGESTGAITFRLDDMATVGGRPILDALIMLLSGTRLFGVAPEHQLPAILAESRRRQADVTNDLAAQVFEALETLLAGFETAAERDGGDLLDAALARDDDHLYGGLLTVLLRLVFVLYAEDRGLLPVEHPFYAKHLSLLALFEQLQRDAGAHPDSMGRRFGAWGRLISLFRAVYLGVEHGDFELPSRRGQLFDPHQYPFLEGWGPAGSAPISRPEARMAVHLPSVDDGTVFKVLERLIVFQCQRLSYRTLDVEQIGSVYEALMGYHIVRLIGPAVRIKLGSKKSAARAWVEVEELLSRKSKQRSMWLKGDLGFDNSVVKKITKALKDAGDEEETALEALAELTGPLKERERHRAGMGKLVVQPGLERRRTSSHYTPRSLSAPIVARTLEPLIACLGEEPKSEDLLSLTICDPAMGSGAFLVEACRFMADQVVAAWTREGKMDLVTDAADEVVNHARRLVAQRCLYGVDKNPYAVNLAKLSLWLVTLAKDLPFTFLDHALRHGDSLVGLDFDQIRSFHWKPGGSKQIELFGKEVEQALDEAVEIRKQIHELSADTSPAAQREKERLLFDAEDALDRVRLIGDLVVGAFFAEAKDKGRKAERDRRLELVHEWLASGEPAPPDLLEMQAEIRERLPVFHWHVEFPEVFYANRQDPLECDAVNNAAYFDAFIGNPPFEGQASVSANNGTEYVFWLLGQHEGSHGSCDISGHFLRRASNLAGKNGYIGFITTSSISEGKTRESSLKWLLKESMLIYEAIRAMEWPGEASVWVAIVHLAKGDVLASKTGKIRLNGRDVEAINSKLRPKPEREDPVKLASNDNMASRGLEPRSDGFIISCEERERLIQENRKNRERIFEYIGGAEVNSSPGLNPDRFIINFGPVSLETASQWPDLLSIVEERVKPGRMNPRNHGPGMKMKRNWWQFYSENPISRTATSSLDRCLVTSELSKHLMFCFQPVGRIKSNTLYVIALESYTGFSILQSRAHVVWSYSMSSSMGLGRRYSVTACFETFPFPGPEPRKVLPALEKVGKRAYELRTKYMLGEDVGLTITYNRLMDPGCEDPRIDELRDLHEEMDRAVLDAYGWSDVAVPPFCLKTPEDHAALEKFQDEVIDRLFVLNAERAAEEERMGLRVKKKAKGAKGKRKGRKKASSQKELGLEEGE